MPESEQEWMWRRRVERFRDRMNEALTSSAAFTPEELSTLLLDTYDKAEYHLNRIHLYATAEELPRHIDAAVARWPTKENAGSGIPFEWFVATLGDSMPSGS